MKIIKGADKSHVEWTTRKLVEMVEDGKVNFDIDIQRGFVWKNNDRKSAFIRSLILDRHVPPLYFNKVDDIYEGEDGKQRTYTVIKFLKDEFELSGLEVFSVINDDGETEELDINGYRFSDLPECFQNAIKEYTFTICFTYNAEPEEVSDTFFNLNNGQTLNAATMNRVKAKSKEQIIRLGKHKLFKEALSVSALNGHVNDDLIIKSHIMLHEAEPCMNTAYVRPYMKETIITEEDEKELNDVFNAIISIHGLIEDNKIAKRIYTKTHMVSVVPIILRGIKEGRSYKDMMEWFVGFYCGKRSATNSVAYNMASGSGSGRKESVRTRQDEITKDYEKHFNIA